MNAPALSTAFKKFKTKNFKIQFFDIYIKNIFNYISNLMTSLFGFTYSTNLSQEEKAAIDQTTAKAR
jgi:hypothetical protein